MSLMLLERENAVNVVAKVVEEVVADGDNEQDGEMDEGLRMLEMDYEDDDDEEIEFDEVFVGNASVAGEIDAESDNWTPRLL